MKAHVDPATGKLVDEPAPGTPPVPGDVRVPTAPVEKPAPGGGVQLDLDPHDGEEDEDAAH
jgi:hypothetical protein